MCVDKKRCQNPGKGCLGTEWPQKIPSDIDSELQSRHDWCQGTKGKTEDRLGQPGSGGYRNNPIKSLALHNCSFFGCPLAQLYLQCFFHHYGSQLSILESQLSSCSDWTVLGSGICSYCSIIPNNFISELVLCWWSSKGHGDMCELRRNITVTGTTVPGNPFTYSANDDPLSTEF